MGGNLCSPGLRSGDGGQDQMRTKRRAMREAFKRTDISSIFGINSPLKTRRARAEHASPVLVEGEISLNLYDLRSTPEHYYVHLGRFWGPMEQHYRGNLFIYFF